MSSADPDPWDAGVQNERVTARGLAAARDLGLATTVYTVNDPARMLQLRGLGVAGIFTDGDLRRCLARGTDIIHRGVADLMTRTPRSIEPHRLAADCVLLMETPPKVTQLVVVDADGMPVGAVHMHDLFRARVV